MLVLGVLALNGAALTLRHHPKIRDFPLLLLRLNLAALFLYLAVRLVQRFG